MKKTKACMNIRCDCCGTYDVTCDICKKPMEYEDIIICDDVKYDYKSSGKHYHKNCFDKCSKKGKEI